MQYINLILDCPNAEQQELWLARSTDMDFLGMEEKECTLIISFSEDSEDLKTLIGLLDASGQSYSTETIAAENWNAQWESSFEPIIVSDPSNGHSLVYVRASFHAQRPDIPREICITPKMSFGTGHHATTLQMMQQMSQLDFSDKTVFDFGTGTGILAIYAEMLGAKGVMAIDYDPWCIENTKENLETNNAQNVAIECMDQCPILTEPVDLMLANINLNVILDNLLSMIASTKPMGFMLLSGILELDRSIIEHKLEQSGLQILHTESLNQWLVILVQKPA
jgi:ribosomal protein L11 methyltransferase